MTAASNLTDQLRLTFGATKTPGVLGTVESLWPPKGSTASTNCRSPPETIMLRSFTRNRPRNRRNRPVCRRCLSPTVLYCDPVSPLVVFAMVNRIQNPQLYPLHCYRNARCASEGLSCAMQYPRLLIHGGKKSAVVGLEKGSLCWQRLQLIVCVQSLNWCSKSVCDFP